jgi:hypothetical protein
LKEAKIHTQAFGFDRTLHILLWWLEVEKLVPFLKNIFNIICFTFIMILVFLLFTLLLSLYFFGPMVSYLIIYEKAANTRKYNRRHSEFQWTKATQQLMLSAIGVADCGYFPPDHSSANTADAYRSMMLKACVFVTRDTVRHPRRIFGRKLNCSWSEAFRELRLDQYVFYVGNTVDRYKYIMVLLLGQSDLNL